MMEWFTISSLMVISGTPRASLGEGNGSPLQCSCLESPMDGGAWWAAVHGVAKSWTQLSDFTFTFHFHFSLSCIGEGNGNLLQYSAWRIPGTGEPGGLLSMGSHRVGHDWNDLAAAAAAVMESIYLFLTFCTEVMLPCISFINTDAFCQWGFHKGIDSRLQWWNITFVKSTTARCSY